MTELLTAEQMRTIEQAAIKSGAVSGLELMECAGQGVVAAIFKAWPELTQGAEKVANPAHQLASIRQEEKANRAVVLCGPGNNGGDGYVVARLLKKRGWAVDVWSLAAPSETSPDAFRNFAAWTKLGGQILSGDDLAQKPAPDLVVDAIFGTGLTRPVPIEVANLLCHLRDIWGRSAAQDGQKLRCVAVDIPSGLSSDTGKILFPQTQQELDVSGDSLGCMDWAFNSDLTVTFHNAKLGHYLNAGPDLSGKLIIVPLTGVPVYDSPLGGQVSVEGHVRLLSPSQKKEVRPVDLLRSITEKNSGHKFDHGHALVLSGPPGQGGAARLAARGALRIGAGLVTVGCPMRAVTEHAIHLNAIMVRGLDGTHGLLELLEDDRINAVCLGPGLGLGPATADLVRNALSAKRGTVLDADALSRFQRKPEVLFEALHNNCVLTPHGGEFARLFPDIAARFKTDPGFSKVDATRDAAKRAGCVVLLKGADTVIAAPDGDCAINASVYEQSAPWLATAGSGDVLAGMITGLLARGLDALGAAQAGAWLHAECARSFGPGLIAEDLPEQLPKVFRSLGN